jgi:hypothetical protein
MRSIASAASSSSVSRLCRTTYRHGCGDLCQRESFVEGVVPAFADGEQAGDAESGQ